ncbi:MAG: hypothetical protein GY943_02835 [Chloroflexi bacterium]|nr:hypothetical protein [Chloroflexota bacterium]
MNQHTSVLEVHSTRSVERGIDVRCGLNVLRVLDAERQIRHSTRSVERGIELARACLWHRNCGDGGCGVERPFEFGDKPPDSNAKPFGLKTGQRPLQNEPGGSSPGGDSRANLLNLMLMGIPIV